MPSAPSTIDPRLDRGEGIQTTGVLAQPTSSGDASGYPNVRLWTFGFHRTANQFRVVWSPTFNGPALVLDVTITFNPPTIPLLRIEVVNNAPANSAGAGAGGPFGENIWESPPGIGQDVTVYDTVNSGIPFVQINAGPGNAFTAPIGRLITRDRFSLGIVNSAGDLVSAAQVAGYVRVAEGTSIDQLRGFR